MYMIDNLEFLDADGPEVARFDVTVDLGLGHHLVLNQFSLHRYANGWRVFPPALSEAAHRVSVDSSDAVEAYILHLAREALSATTSGKVGLG